MNQKVHDIHILVSNTHLFIGLKKHIIPPPIEQHVPQTRSRRTRPYESLVPESRTKGIRKDASFPIVREMCQMSDTAPLYLFTKEEYEELRKDWMKEKAPLEADEFTSCIYFVRNHWTNKQYKQFRNSAEDFKIRLVPFDQMRKALHTLMPIPQPVRCQNSDLCKKCGILGLLEMLQFEMSLPDVQANIRFFPKDMITTLVNKLKLDSGRTFDGFKPDSPTILKR